MKGISLTDTLQINSVIWIRSLSDHELNSSRRIVEDLESLSSQSTFAFEEHVVADRQKMLDLLKVLAESAAKGLRPILHFDCHGSKTDGLCLMPSGEFLSWAHLADALRSINTATENNLCCVFGVCFGLRMSMSISLTKASPYYLTIAPEREVSVGVLEDRTAAFYRHLYKTGNITQAFADIMTPELSMFHCKEVFARALATYIANNCVGKAALARRERMVTALLEKENIVDPSSSQLKNARAKIKAAFEPSQALINRYASTFLLGREPGFGFEELEQLSRGYVARKQRIAARTNKLGTG